MLTETLNSVKTRSPLQVFAIFAVGIILPSAFLSFLGLRSFQYEGALMQKQTEEQYAAVANLIQKELEGRTSGWVATLRAFASQDAIEHMNVADSIPRILMPETIEKLPIDHLFVFDEEDRLLVPPPDEGGGSDADMSRHLDWGAWSDDLQSLEHLEFVEKNIPEAIKGYIALQSKHLPPALQAELLKSIAGGYRKLHETRSAEAAYLKLVREYDSLKDISGVPIGVLARQLLISLYDEEQSTARATDLRMELMEGLLFRRWTLPGSRTPALIQELRSTIDKNVSAHGMDWDDRRRRWDRLREVQEKLERLKGTARPFVQNVWPDISKRLRLRGWLEQGGILELGGTAYAQQVVVVAPIFSPGSERRRGLLVALVRADGLWPLMDATLRDLATPVGLQVHWTHSASPAAADSIQTTLWKARLDRQVESIDPPVHFTLSESNSQERNRLSRRRLWIYGGMIGLSFIVIMVGLFLMRRAVRREIEVANLKADFVANVSHELRTPLTTISYIGERLNMGRYKTEDERKEFYGMLDKETHRLRDLIEDILDFSKMLAGKKMYRQEPLELASLVQEAQERFQGKAQAKGFEVAVDLPSEDVPIKGDRKALLQAVLNLLDNALKYSGQSRKIDVAVRRTADRGIISVRDYGIGISDTDKEKIFEKFYRVESALARDSEGGVGLGLAMVKHIIEGHGGLIRVESRIGEGSLFSFEFPLAL